MNTNEPANNKKCTQCNNTKSIIDFHKRGKDKHGNIAYQSICKQCRKRENNPEKREEYNAYMREYNKKITVQEKRKEYRQKPEIKEKHRIEVREALKDPVKRDLINKRQRERNKKPVAQQAKKEYYNKPEIKERESTRKRKYRIDPTKREKVLEHDARHSHKRRGLNYTPLNKQFKNCHRHHFLINEHGEPDLSIALCIPKTIHESIFHDGSTGTNMIEINEACLQWYIETYRIKDVYNSDIEAMITKLQKIVEFTKEEVKNGWRNRYEIIEVVQ